MPTKSLYLLWRFLQQNEGRLSARARAKEFAELTADEAKQVEEVFKDSWDA